MTEGHGGVVGVRGGAIRPRRSIAATKFAQLLSRLCVRRDAQAGRHLSKSYVEKRVFVVRIAIDWNLQRSAEESHETRCASSGAATITRPRPPPFFADLDGGVRAMCGGRDYGPSQFNLAVDSYRP